MFVTVKFLDDDEQRVITSLQELQKGKKTLKRWPATGDHIEAYWPSGKGFWKAQVIAIGETDPKPKGKAKEKGVSFLLFFSLFLKTFLPDTDFFVLLHFEKQKETEKERAKAEFETSARILDDLYGSSSRGISGSSSSSSSNPNRGLKRAELKGQEGWYLSPRDFQMF